MEQVFQKIQSSTWTPPWLADVRSEAFARFKILGWPSREQEDWRYTSTKPLAQAHFAPSIHVPAFDPAWQSFYLAGAYRLVFVNGSYVSGESSLPDSPGIKVSSLEEALRSERSLIEPLLRAETKASLGALNQALVNSGAFVQIARNVQLDRPLQLLHVQCGGESAAALITPRHFLQLEEGAQATVLESFFSVDEAHFTNTASDVQLKAGAQLLHVSEKILGTRSLHINRSHFSVQQDAQLKTFTLNLGGQINRHEQHIVLEGPGSSAQFDGLYLGRQKSHIDMNTSIEHRAPHSKSSQIYKGILYDQSRAIFDGKIAIAKHAQQTRADQLNKNLLMSTEAEIDTKPQLRIDADDVKCSHGATVGRLDRNELFYLQSRGIDRETGERMLSKAFVRDVLSRIQHDALESRLAGLLEAYSGDQAL